MVDEKVLQQVVRRIVAMAQPRRVILFGSYGRGDADEGSDLDLMVVLPDVPDKYGEIIRLHKAVGMSASAWTCLCTRRRNTSGAVKCRAPCCIGRARKGGACMKPHIDEAWRSLRLADRDITAFDLLKYEPEVHVSIVCFHAQQAVEKSLKAVLYSRQIEFERTHDLVNWRGRSAITIIDFCLFQYDQLQPAESLCGYLPL